MHAGLYTRAHEKIKALSFKSWQKQQKTEKEKPALEKIFFRKIGHLHHTGRSRARPPPLPVFRRKSLSISAL